MNFWLLCAVPVLLVFLRHGQAQTDGICYVVVVETSTISVSAVVSNTYYYSCGWFGWSTCSGTMYSSQLLYKTISQSRSQFTCCAGYLQIGASQSCRANVTSGPALPTLDAVAVTASSPSSLCLVWSLHNSNGSLVPFNASCTSEDGSHRVNYSVGLSLNATLGGLMPSTYYTCCVWTVVGGPMVCAAPTQTQGLCDGFINSSSCLNASSCLKYYYNTTNMECLCQTCPNANNNTTALPAAGGGEVAALLATLVTIAVVVVVVAVVLAALIVYRKAHPRHSLADVVDKMEPNPSYQLLDVTGSTNGSADAAKLNSEYAYATTPHCTLDQPTHKVTNPVNTHANNVCSNTSQHTSDERLQEVTNPVYEPTKVSEYSKLDHTLGMSESPDNYNRLAHPIATNNSDNVYSALNEGISTDLEVVDGYSILKGPPPRNTNTSNEVYSTLEHDANGEFDGPLPPVSTTTNPLYGMPAVQKE